MKLAFATAIVSTVYALPATNSTTTPLVKQQRRFEDFKRLFEAVFDPSEMNKVCFNFLKNFLIFFSFRFTDMVVTVWTAVIGHRPVTSVVLSQLMKSTSCVINGANVIDVPLEIMMILVRPNQPSTSFRSSIETQERSNVLTQRKVFFSSKKERVQARLEPRTIWVNILKRDHAPVIYASVTSGPSKTWTTCSAKPTKSI